MNTASPGSLIALTATVQAGGAAVTNGIVNFCNAAAPICTDINLVGTAQLTSTGTATILIHPALGSHSYKATYLGTPAGSIKYGGSSSSSSGLTVTGASTTTKLTSTAGSGNFALTATVTPAIPGRPSPTGTVTFLDSTNGNAVVGSASLQAASLRTWNSTRLADLMTTGPVAVCDFNGDGHLDLVMVINKVVTTYLGVGDGGLGVPISGPTSGNSPSAIGTGDFNSDGKLDLAVANSADNTVSILLGNGDGTFAPGPQMPTTGVNPTAIAVSDLNRDGKLDLVLTNFADNTLTILLGKGDGTFQTGAQQPATITGPKSITVGDFNGDGVPDIAVGQGVGYSSSGYQITILLGTGDGSFTSALQSPLAAPGPVSVQVADVNGDGKLDLVAVTQVEVLEALGNGDGTFTLSVAVPHAMGVSYGSFVLGDYDNDGKPDLAVIYSIDGYTKSVEIELGTADGSFKDIGRGSGVHDVLAEGDFNGDGMADIVSSSPTVSETVIDQPIFTGQQLFNSDPTATVTNVSLSGFGTHLVNASYSGDNYYLPSTSPAISIVNLPPAAAPTFNPLGGTYSSAQTVTISDSSPGVTIYYEINGTTPTTSSRIYTTPINIPASTTLTAIALGGNYSSSPMTSAVYTITSGKFVVSATSLTLAPGGSGASTVTVSSTEGYTGTVSLSCAVTSQPTGAVNAPTCKSGQTITLNSSATSGTATVQVSTTPAVTSARVPSRSNNSNRLLLCGGGTVLGLITLLFVPSRRREWWARLGIFFIFITGMAGFLIVGCGGHNKSGSVAQGTTAGTYAFTITATGNDAAKTVLSTTFTLTVQ